MKKFVFVYYGSDIAKDASQEEMKASRDKWMTWFGNFKDKMVDGGNPFASGAKSVTAKGVETIPADMWPATGYTIINAKDIHEATKIAQGCPLLDGNSNGTVRVYEAMPM